MEGVDLMAQTRLIRPLLPPTHLPISTFPHFPAFPSRFAARSRDLRSIFDFRSQIAQRTRIRILFARV